MSRKFVGKLIRIMMTKSSSCDILKKKRTIRRGSGSRPKGPYLMDLRFWNYVIPDGSTTAVTMQETILSFGTMSFQMVLLLLTRQRVTPPSFGTMSFQMVLLPALPRHRKCWSFGTMSFQMVLLQNWKRVLPPACFGTMSFQMVLLPQVPADIQARVLELCHSRWFYYQQVVRFLHFAVLELCHSRWFYYMRSLDAA